MNKTGMSPETAEKVRIAKGIGKGTKLRRLRVLKGLSQSELAEKSGVPKKTIQRFEQNSDDINHTKLNTYCDLCMALECGIEDIIESEALANKYKAVK
ncbi:MAG: helix-turn-helix transcriptional regulator [Clostridia bacterium]|nr:helix-turn-helix transcriptional regulator [Clostridia bacterium]